MDVGVEDLITSFSNPNYGLGCNVAELQVHSTCRTNNNNDVEGDDTNAPPNLADGAAAAAAWHRGTPSSGDSAISSPATDSCLASPSGANPLIISIQDNSVASADDTTETSNGAENSGNIEQCVDETEHESRHTDKTFDVLRDVNLSDGTAIDLSVQSKASKVLNDGQSLDGSRPMKLVLPSGWKKCEDADGPYYWHVKSGTLQREPPDASYYQPISNGDTMHSENNPSTATGTTLLSAPDVVQSSPSSSRETLVASVANNRCDSELKSAGDGNRADSPRSSSPSSSSPSQYPIRYAVRSLGWVEIAEQELTQERSSRAVNKAIIDLSAGRRDLNDAVGRWGDGKYLYMDVDQETLSLVSPGDLTVLNVQPIRTIRVWGVGRDNGRDFAYVARDRTSRRYMCHVFRCEVPARRIAATLCEICKRVVAQRVTSSASAEVLGGGAIVGRNHAGPSQRPADLPNLTSVTPGDGASEGPEGAIKYDALLKNCSFPTPMDEPRKLMNCHYLGTIVVAMPTGVEILNGAIDMLNARVPAERWTYVDVTVAPSTITIVKHENPDEILAECRVRFLSFLGISLKNARLCSFIMHTAQDQFYAHVFYCEPSAGALCKTIEAACKLRYQKCLDKSLPGAATGGGGSSSTLLSPSSDSASRDNESTGSSKDSIDSADETLHSRFTLLENLRAGQSNLISSLSAAAASVKGSVGGVAQSMKGSVGGVAQTVKGGFTAAVGGVTGERVVTSIGVAAHSAKSSLVGAFGALRKKTAGYLEIRKDAGKDMSGEYCEVHKAGRVDMAGRNIEHMDCEVNKDECFETVMTENIVRMEQRGEFGSLDAEKESNLCQEDDETGRDQCGLESGIVHEVAEDAVPTNSRTVETESEREYAKESGTNGIRPWKSEVSAEENDCEKRCDLSNNGKLRSDDKNVKSTTTITTTTTSSSRQDLQDNCSDAPPKALSL